MHCTNSKELTPYTKTSSSAYVLNYFFDVCMAWRCGPEVKSMGSSSREPRFDSQRLHCSSQTSGTPVPGTLIPSLGLRQKSRQNTHVQKINIRGKFLNLYVCVWCVCVWCMCVWGMSVPWCVCGGQRTTLCSHFSPFTSKAQTQATKLSWWALYLRRLLTDHSVYVFYNSILNLVENPF